MPTAWNWSFGDGSLVNITDKNPVHTFTNAGTYSVSLNATNSAGSATITRGNYIRVVSPVPQAYFSITPEFGTAPLLVTFTDGSTNAVSLSWSYGDGGTSSDTNPTHTYNDNQTFTVSLTATNSAGKSNTMNRTISMFATPPANVTVANFTESQPIITSPIITFNSGSSKNVTTWDWDFGDGTAHNTTENPVHNYANPGTYTVTLVTKYLDIPVVGGVSTTPSIASISPATGPTAGGTVVTITGTNFNDATEVKFGATAATTFAVNSNTQITATSPDVSSVVPVPGVVDVSVTTAGGTSAIVAGDQFTYT